MAIIRNSRSTLDNISELASAYTSSWVRRAQTSLRNTEIKSSLDAAKETSELLKEASGFALEGEAPIQTIIRLRKEEQALNEFFLNYQFTTESPKQALP